MTYHRIVIYPPDGRVWSSNSDHAASRWAVSRHRKAVREQAAWLALAARIQPLERAHITATVHLRNWRQADPQNYPGGATLKAAIDGLVDHGVIPDDTQDYLSVVTVLAPLGDDGPRVVLEITADDSSTCPSCHAAWEDADHATCDRLLAEDQDGAR